VSAETDMIKLYSGRILALAADVPHTARLDAPDGTAKKRSPLCGSTVTVDVKLSGGKISAFAQDVKACALGQAAAAVVGANIVGQTPDVIAKGRDELNAMLRLRRSKRQRPRHKKTPRIRDRMAASGR